MSILIANNYRIDLAPEEVKCAKYSLYRRSLTGLPHHFSLIALYENKALLVRDVISDEIFRKALKGNLNSLSDICDITEKIVAECINAFSSLEAMAAEIERVGQQCAVAFEAQR